MQETPGQERGRRRAVLLLQRSDLQKRRRFHLRKVAAELAHICRAQKSIMHRITITPCSPITYIHHRHATDMLLEKPGTEPALTSACSSRADVLVSMSCEHLKTPVGKRDALCPGIVITGNTARQAVTAAAQQTQGRPARAAPEPAKDAPVQRRAVALPKPLASDHLRSGKTSPDTGKHYLYHMHLPCPLPDKLCETLRCTMIISSIIGHKSRFLKQLPLRQCIG